MKAHELKVDAGVGQPPNCIERDGPDQPKRTPTAEEEVIRRPPGLGAGATGEKPREPDDTLRSLIGDHDITPSHHLNVRQ